MLNSRSIANHKICCKGLVKAGYAKQYPAGYKRTGPTIASEHEPDAWRDIDEMEMTSLVLIESSCGCKFPGHQHGNEVAGWKHEKECQLFAPAEAGPDAEPEPFETMDLELTSSIWILSNCACMLSQHEQHILHEHKTECHLFVAQPSPEHEPYPETFVDMELTSWMLIMSMCACEWQITKEEPMKPCDHEEGCHVYEPPPEASFYLLYVVSLFPTKLGICTSKLFCIRS